MYYSSFLLLGYYMLDSSLESFKYEVKSQRLLFDDLGIRDCLSISDYPGLGTYHEPWLDIAVHQNWITLLFEFRIDRKEVSQSTT